MENKKGNLSKIITFFLLTCILITSLAACKANDSTTTNNLIQTEDTVQYKADYLPSLDYGGASYRIMEYDSHTKHLTDEPIGVIDHAIFKRNSIIENRYNIKFEVETKPFSTWWEVTPIVQKLAASQDAQYELITLSHHHAYLEVISGDVALAEDLPIIDMSQPWHYQLLNDSMTIDGVSLLDFTAFDMNEGGPCLIFNETILQSLNLDNPYELVKSGKWTYDQLYTMAAKGKLDRDTDGQWTESDRYGFISAWDYITTMAYGGTGETLIVEKEGTLSQNKSEALVTSLIYASEKLKEDGMVFDPFKAWGQTEASRFQGVQSFIKGNSLFLVGNTDNIKYFGNMENDFGILPFPKWSEKQSDYILPVLLIDISVPLACHPNLDYVCIIKEALAVETLNYYNPAYYENCIQNRYLRHEEDIEMLQIITDGRTCDLGVFPWYEICRNPLQETISAHSTGFVSALESCTTQTELKITELMEFVKSVKK